MNKIVAGIISKQAAKAAGNVVDNAKEVAENIRKLGEEDIIISRKVFSLEIAVAVLGGIVLGMLISPRKKVSYKIASNNHDIGELAPDRHRAPGYDEYDEDEDEDEEEDSSGNDADDDDADEDEAPDNGRSKFIKL